ncbi:MAG TPA: carbohydrate porin [Candidatus Binatia bacterium]|nr:carbohydrate porin [Candidatus Binatia bacterium]
MAKVRRHGSHLFEAVLVFLLSFTCVTGVVALDSAPTGPNKKQDEATLFPVPDFTSDIWKRAKLTGDWGGLRSTMARNGVQLDIDNVHTFQNVTSGGIDNTGRYLGNAEIVLKLDSKKMGLWPGGFLLVRGEAAFGTGVNQATGALLPVNTRPVLSLPARDEMVLSHVVLTQFLHEKFAVALGKLDTTTGDANEFAHGRGDEKFMNLAFSFSPAGLRIVPYSTLGMGFVFLPTKDLVLGFSAIDTEGVTTRTGFDTLFKDGTTLASEGRLTVRPFGLTGHQLISFAWSNGDFNSLSQDPRTLIGNALFDTSLKKESGSWVFMYNFDQYLYQEKEDSSQGVGIFGRFGISDGKANPIAQFYSFGFGGKGIIPGRDQDRFGIGYYYMKISGDLRDTFPPLLIQRAGLDHEQGVELFYNIAATPWLHVTPDLQFIDSARNKAPLVGANRKAIDTAVVAGLRIKIDF